MKQLFLFVPLISLVSIAVLAQSPTPVISPTASPTSTQTDSSPSPTPTPAVARTGPPNLSYMVEVLACVVMVGSVLTVFVLVWRQQQLNQESIGPRHIQFVSVCLIVPTILILGLEQALSRETTATLIGGLTGYLLSGLGKDERRKPDRGQGGTDKGGEPAGGDEITPDPDNTELADTRTKAERDHDKLRALAKKYPGITLSRREPPPAEPKESPPPKEL